MGARILSLLLGAMLTGFGWAMVEPKGPAGLRLPPLDLGMFEGHRAFIGWGVLALGIVSLLSAVLPKGGRKGGKRRAPPVVTFDAEPEPPVEVPEEETPAHNVRLSSSPTPSALW